MQKTELEYIENGLRHYTFEELLSDFVYYNKSENELLFNFLIDSKYKLYPNSYLAKLTLNLLKKISKKVIPKEMQDKLIFS